MKKKSNSLNKSFEKGQGKNTTINTIKQRVYDYLQQDVATTKMLSFALEVNVKSLCGAIRRLEKIGLLQKVVKNGCNATGNKAYFLTTKKELFKSNYKTN